MNPTEKNRLKSKIKSGKATKLDLDNYKEKQAFKLRQEMDLCGKIAATKSRISAFLEWCDLNDIPAYQSHSGGKDSTVLRHIIRSMGLDAEITPVFSNTGLELPEIVKFARKTKGMVEVRPKKDYRKVWQEDGLPIGSKMTSKKLRVLQGGKTEKNANMYNLYDTGITSDGRSAPSYKLAKKWRHLIDNEHKIKFTDKCCDHLKKEPLDTYQKKEKGGRLDAMMADEGGKRGDKHVCTIFDSKKPHSSPMLFWLEKDIWDYIKLHNVEICEVYYGRVFDLEGNCLACDSPHTNNPSVGEFNSKRFNIIRQDEVNDAPTWFYYEMEGEEYYFIAGEKRTGCSFCGFGAHLEKGSNRFQRLSVSHPRLHRIIMERMYMKQALDLINVPTEFDIDK